MGDEAPPPPEVVPPLSGEVLEERLKLFDAFYGGLSADAIKLASLEERKAKEKEDNLTLTYGELEMPLLNTIMNKVKTDCGPLYAGKGIFLDVGSGAGKACIAAALLHPFQKVVGIECVECLQKYTDEALAKYNEEKPEGLVKPEVEFIKADFMESAALGPLEPEVVFCLAVSVCYSDEQMQALGKLAEKMPADACFVTFTQPLPETLVPFNKKEGPGWTLMHQAEYEMAWGMSTCFIYKKVPEPVTEAAEAAPAEEAQ
eukprot:gnl/TRDRNA2_/TRDRNA2_180089_c0_seq1.p1 gnl/TRDRNA2_/TRDRNA2_180089_c0~~gnl/TRDRNA2_/TRDRNA2_180089_c0_seq1.p1  ORF type:complete len:299 (+),score=79.78 gnl/TRDRNA2_/TRDRNA2_180089_c0_seq1:123-899(+)